MPPFSSTDFHRTKAQLEVRLPAPERLLHRQVAGRVHGTFSEERGHGVAIVDLPAQTMSLTIGLLHGAQSTRRHRHNYETIIYIVKGEGYTLIEDTKIEWQAGDAVYIPVWAWHNHVNTGQREAEYVACENTPLLQNIGNIALREEAGRQQEGVSP